MITYLVVVMLSQERDVIVSYRAGNASYLLRHQLHMCFRLLITHRTKSLAYGGLCGSVLLAVFRQTFGSDVAGQFLHVTHELNFDICWVAGDFPAGVFPAGVFPGDLSRLAFSRR